MKFYNNFYISKCIKLLEYKLNGHTDICKKIINYKLNFEQKNTINFYIEKDFYNWLNYDLILRNNLSIFVSNYKIHLLYNITESECNINRFRGFKYIDYFDYYENISLNLLGINHEYMRNKSINDCYKLKWWKTTEKNNLPWYHIHYIIKQLKQKMIIKIYYRKWKYFMCYEDLFVEMLNYPHLFRDPDEIETKFILNNYKNGLINNEIYEQDFSRGFILTDCKLTII